MVDREKVIKGLECCAVGCRSGCPYSDIDDCESMLCADALAMLKAQEPPTDVSISSAIECLLHLQDADDSDMAKAIDTAVRAMRLLKVQEPTSTPEAEWLLYKGRHGATCSFCKHTYYDVYDVENYDYYCRHCGAKMVRIRTVKWK